MICTPSVTPDVGYYSQLQPNQSKQYSTCYTGVTGVIGPNIVLKIFRDIENMEGCPDEDRPSESALQSAKKLLCEADFLHPIFFMPSVIEATEHDILLHWDGASKSVVLICPADDDKPAQVYREVLEGVKAKHSEMSPATPRSLTDALAWMLQSR